MSVRGDLRRCLASVFVAIVAMVSLSACRVDIVTTVNVAESGSGSISVIVTADADAARSAPELATSLNVDDLRNAGWDVGVQNPTPDGGLSVTLKRDFNTPEQATTYLSQLSGPNGPLRDLVLTRNGGLSDATYGFTGTAGLPQGLAGFADDEILAVIGGAPFVETLAANNLALSEALGVSLQVTLPGSPRDQTTGTVTRDDEGLSTSFTWTVPVDGSNVDLVASTRSRNVSALMASIAANAFLVLIVLLAIALVAYSGFVVYRRSRSTPGS